MSEDQDLFRAGGVPGSRRAPAAHALPAGDVAALYEVVAARRDIRNGFGPDPIADDVLTRVLTAAHQAPSVGLSQPWDFIVLRDRAVRERVHALARRQQEVFAAGLPGARARAFGDLKVEAILETPLNIVVTCDPTPGGAGTCWAGTPSRRSRRTRPRAPCRISGWQAPGPRASGWAGSASSTSVSWPPRSACLRTCRSSPTCAWGTSRRSRPRRSWCSAAGPGGGRWPGRCTDGQWGHRGLPGGQPASLLADTIAAIRPLDAGAVAQARERQEALTKPSGSLGVLEQVSVQLAGLAGECPPPLPEPAVVAVFAGDHGVHAQGVTPWPQEVTAQMVANFLASGAVVNAIAAQAGAEVCVVDVGVAADLPAAPVCCPARSGPAPRT